VLAVAGSVNPSAIVSTAILATFFSSAAGITAVKLLEKLPGYRLPPVDSSPAKQEEKAQTEESKIQNPKSEIEKGSVAAATDESAPLASFNWLAWTTLAIFGAAFVWGFLRVGFPELLNHEASADLAKKNNFLRTLHAISILAIPFLLSFFPLYAALRRVKVYEEFVEGAKEGFKTSVMIVPFLVAILVAIGMFRAAGGIEMISNALKPLLSALGFPTELLAMCFIRPLSGSGTLGMFTDIVNEFGPDSLLARTAGTIFGSTETTFYVIAVYFGAVAVKRTRHAVPAGLIADAVGIIASIIICRLMFA
jgi:spore maturation protein B